MNMFLCTEEQAVFIKCISGYRFILKNEHMYLVLQNITYNPRPLPLLNLLGISTMEISYYGNEMY